MGLVCSLATLETSTVCNLTASLRSTTRSESETYSAYLDATGVEGRELITCERTLIGDEKAMLLRVAIASLLGCFEVAAALA